MTRWACRAGTAGRSPIPREAWRTFAENYHLFVGTPSRLWLDHSLAWAFGIGEPLTPDNADRLFDLVGERLKQPELRPLAILDRANVEVIATTEFALDPLNHHRALQGRGLGASCAHHLPPRRRDRPGCAGLSPRISRASPS